MKAKLSWCIHICKLEYCLQIDFICITICHFFFFFCFLQYSVNYLRAEVSYQSHVPLLELNFKRSEYLSDFLLLLFLHVASKVPFTEIEVIQDSPYPLTFVSVKILYVTNNSKSSSFLNHINLN